MSALHPRAKRFERAGVVPTRPVGDVTGPLEGAWTDRNLTTVSETAEVRTKRTTVETEGEYAVELVDTDGWAATAPTTATPFRDPAPWAGSCVASLPTPTARAAIGSPEWARRRFGDCTGSSRTGSSASARSEQVTSPRSRSRRARASEGRTCARNGSRASIPGSAERLRDATSDWAWLSNWRRG